jgi:hypothetical protein
MMLMSADQDTGDETVRFLAGHTAPAGTYLLIGTDREIRLDQEAVLPATFDGRIAVYERRPTTWGEAQGRSECDDGGQTR